MTEAISLSCSIVSCLLAPRPVPSPFPQGYMSGHLALIFHDACFTCTPAGTTCPTLTDWAELASRDPPAQVGVFSKLRSPECTSGSDQSTRSSKTFFGTPSPREYISIPGEEAGSRNECCRGLRCSLFRIGLGMVVWKTVFCKKRPGILEQPGNTRRYSGKGGGDDLGIPSGAARNLRECILEGGGESTLQYSFRV